MWCADSVHTCDVAGLEGREHGAAVPILGHDILGQLHQLAPMVGVVSVELAIVIAAGLVVAPHPELTPAHRTLLRGVPTHDVSAHDWGLWTSLQAQCEGCRNAWHPVLLDFTYSSLIDGPIMQKLP